MKQYFNLLVIAMLFAVPALACGDDPLTSTPESEEPTQEIIPTSTPESEEPTSEPRPTNTPAPTSSITVTGNVVNIRSGPSTNYAIITTLAQGDNAPAIGYDPSQTWVQIELPDNEIGWISASLVEIENPDKLTTITEIPAITTSEQPPATSGDTTTAGGTQPPGNTTTAGETQPSGDTTTAGETQPSDDTTSAGETQPSGDTTSTEGNTGTPFHCSGGCEAPPPDSNCAIKGNVNHNGERIYHVPGGSFYNRTNIIPAEGDRWFCTEKEAQEAGFRESQR